jgi:drug/metabolite transporter (DMT)-like permease
MRSIPSQYHKIFYASLLVAISGTLYGFLGYLGTCILRENLSISTMLFWRFTIAGLWTFLFVIRKNRITNSINLSTFWFVFFLGAIGYAGSSGFYFAASQYTGTGLAMVIFFSYPIMIALISWLKNRNNFNIVTLLTLISMMVGLYLLRDSSAHQLSILGILFGILAAMSYAFYVIGSKRISAITLDSNMLTTIVSFGCAVIFLILSISSHHFIFPQTMKSWLYLFALGIFATALPIQLMLEGLKHISSMRASIISVLEPLVTVGVGIVLLNESVSHAQIIGIFIILISALFIQFQKEL